jgi:SAM-dependent methyltransferase
MKFRLEVPPMGFGYTIAYWTGLRPWEHVGRAGARHMGSLLEREEADRTAPLGRALDLGCGTGGNTITLATRGWQATGIEMIPRAVRLARQRAAAAGVAGGVRFVQGDVTALQALDVGNGYNFLLDVGCFHGLSDAQRTAMAQGVSAVAAKDATLLMVAFQPGRRGPLPRGVGCDDVMAAFTGWTLIDDGAADTLPGPMKSAAPHWYRLRRKGDERL